MAFDEARDVVLGGGELFGLGEVVVGRIQIALDHARDEARLVDGRHLHGLVGAVAGGGEHGLVGLLGAGGVEREGLGGAESLVRAAEQVDVIDRLQYLEGVVIDLDRLDGGGRAGGAIRGLDEIREGARFLAGLHQVVGEIADTLGIGGFQPIGREPVEAAALGPEERIVRGVPRQGVLKRVHGQGHSGVSEAPWTASRAGSENSLPRTAAT